MRYSIHYYVLVLGEHTTRLYEAFRDALIEIQNTRFPLGAPLGTGGSDEPGARDIQLRRLYLKVDQHFAHYYEQDPLGLVVVGEEKDQFIFASVTAHEKVIIGRVDGDYGATSPRDLGKIVWAIVKDVMAGGSEKAMCELEAAVNTRRVASGLAAVGQMATSGMGTTLLVEEDYHVKGSIGKTGNSLIISSVVDIREVFDDAVDVIIETVLATGGHVVFLGSGMLAKLERIALILDN